MYIFNQERKRLEPTETKCQYCELEHSTNMGYNYFIPLYKENDRTNIIVYRSVKYNKIPVGIPRCKSCLLIHLDAETKGARIAWGVAVSVIVLSFVIWGIWGIFAIFDLLFLSYSFFNRDNLFVVNKNIAVIFCSKGVWIVFFFVFLNSKKQVRSYSGI